MSIMQSIELKSVNPLPSQRVASVRQSDVGRGMPVSYNQNRRGDAMDFFVAARGEEALARMIHKTAHKIRRRQPTTFGKYNADRTAARQKRVADILRLLSDWKTNAEIAEVLSIKKDTVKEYTRELRQDERVEVRLENLTQFFRAKEATQ